jgi:thiol-disulfide isomerase/thioredoxin
MMIRQMLAAAFVAVAIPAYPVLADEPNIRSLLSGSIKEIRATHRGIPMIVHFWGLSCGPCLIEMPDWGRLLSERPGLNLVVIHADRLPRDMRLLSESIARAGLTKAQNWAFGDGSSDRLRFEIDPKWQGEIPMTLLIAPDGTTRRIVGSADMTEIRNWLAAQTSYQGSGGTLSNLNTLSANAR